MNRPTYIYALCCPDTGEVRYIGKASNPKTRLEGHLSDARRLNRKQSHKINWLKKLLSHNKLPQVQILEQTDIENWPVRERHWIEHFRKGGRLTNVSDGGEGCLVNGKHPMFGKNLSLETKQKMSVAHSGEGNPMFGKPAPNRGVPHSPETRAKLGRSGEKNGNYGKPAWNSGIPMRDEVKAKVSKALSGELNPHYGRTGELATCFGRVGEKHPMFGKHHTDEAKRKISESSKGRTYNPMSDETKRKLSEAKKGKPRSKEAIAKTVATFARKRAERLDA